jgi:hypothetical protein
LVVLPVFDRSKAIDGAGGGAGNLQGREGRGGAVRPCSDEKKLVRRWQEVLPNQWSISHAHQ